MSICHIAGGFGQLRGGRPDTDWSRPTSQQFRPRASSTNCWTVPIGFAASLTRFEMASIKFDQMWSHVDQVWGALRQSWSDSDLQKMGRGGKSFAGMVQTTLAKRVSRLPSWTALNHIRNLHRHQCTRKRPACWSDRLLCCLGCPGG